MINIDLFSNVENHKLDKNQIKAITNKKSNNLVIAGAGSGKTTTIVGKVKYLLEIEHYKEDEILVLSFTNASAKEMKNRIFKETKKELNIMTFHKLGLMIMEKTASSIPRILINNKKIIFDIINILIKNYNYYENFLMFIYSIKENKLNKYKELFKQEKHLLFEFTSFISNFINIMKQNNYTPEKLIKLNTSKRYQLFISLVSPIYNNYQNILLKNNEIDFNDMINKSLKIIKSKKLQLNYKYLIVDEYQDISKGRYELIKEIITQTNSNLFCVGDDFQCIYSFAGSEIDYFINFEKYFGVCQKTIIDKTYRFNQSLVDLAGTFIMKNKNQIKKYIVSYKNNNEISLELIEGNNYLEITNCLSMILKKLPYYSTIFFLGRYKKDIDIIKISDDFYIEKNKEIIYYKRIDLKITFMTVHQAKGLEADYTFILNNLNIRLGFPSKIIDDKILRVFKINNDNYPYSEERRLFYVAITRSKIKTYLIVLSNYQSIFIKEIKKYIKNYK